MIPEPLAAGLRAHGFRGRLLGQAPLAPLTTWRIGGAADLLARPENIEDVRLAVDWAGITGLPWRVMGNGSNLLVADQGVRGVVIQLRRTLDERERTEEGFRVGAGHSFPHLAREAAAEGLGGLEFAAGIPGTVGGAVVMNAGWHEFEIAASIVTVRTLSPQGALQDHPVDDCELSYRHSRFRRSGEIVLSAELRLRREDPAGIVQRMERFATSRKQNQPTELPSCGSVFLKPPGDFAGRLIEAAGWKGRRIGNLQVSPKHANFFVNLGGATAAEALELVERVEQDVLDRFGVRLVREFECW